MIGRRFAFRGVMWRLLCSSCSLSRPRLPSPFGKKSVNSLFVCFLNQFRLDRTPNRSVVVPVTDHNISRILGSRAEMSIFERFGQEGGGRQSNPDQ